MKRILQTLAVLGPFIVLYFFGWLNSIGLYNDDSPWIIANIISSIMLFIAAGAVTIFVITALIEEYVYYKRELHAKRRAAIRLIQEN